MEKRAPRIFHAEILWVSETEHLQRTASKQSCVPASQICSKTVKKQKPALVHTSIHPTT